MKHQPFLFGGIAILLAAWLGPLPQLAEHSFAAHMSLHLTLILGVAPLIAFGLSGGRIDEWLVGVGLLNPILASVAELVVVWAWHAPALHALSRSSASAFAVEQLSFLAVGFVLWLSITGGLGSADRRASIGVIALLLTSMHMTLLGALLCLASRPLYPHHASHGGRDALVDQQLGGLLMLGFAGTFYLLAALWLLSTVLRNKEPARGLSSTQGFGRAGRGRL